VNPDTPISPRSSSDVPPQLSVVVITRNEVSNLPRLLDAVKGWADEIVVFDSGSTDGTVAIAEAAGAVVVNCPWEGWSTTKNKANAAARGEWILSLDADEAPDKACADAIAAHIKQGARDAQGAWRVGEINRLTRYCGSWVRHSGWFPDRKVRLWPRGAARWEGAIHEVPVFEDAVRVSRLSGIVEHHSYPFRADHLSQIEKFGQVWAQDRFERGQSTALPLVLVKVCAQWLKTFVVKRGFLDGATGWTIARLSAWATWRKHARLRQLHRGGIPDPRRILVARTDALGDLVLTLPMLAALKQRFPQAQVHLLVRPYAADVARAALHADEVHCWTEAMAQDPLGAGAAAMKSWQPDAVVFAFPDVAAVQASAKAAVPIRIGTGRRWHTLTRLTHRNWDGRKESGGHEAWHGLRLLMPLGIEPSSAHRHAVHLGAPAPEEDVQALLETMADAPILLHPGSHGSAGNWAPERFAQLAVLLAEKGHTVGFTGTAQEGEDFAPYLPSGAHIHALFGRLSLHQLLVLQSQARAVVASSTGPLHTATALGTPGVGLYGTRAPEWAARWAPIGPHVTVLDAAELDSDGHLDIAVETVLEAAISSGLPRAAQSGRQTPMP